MAAQGAFRGMRTCAILVLLCLTVDQQASAASETARSYYDSLNVEPTATTSQIKRSFRSLAMRYHPDKNKSAQAENTFREIAEAYAVLSDKKKRILYDSVGHEAFLENQASLEPEDDDDNDDEAGFHFSFSDFFQDFHDSAFTDEPHLHWSFLQDVEEEDVQYKRYSFEESTFYFEDEYEGSITSNY